MEIIVPTKPLEEINVRKKAGIKDCVHVVPQKLPLMMRPGLLCIIYVVVCQIMYSFIIFVGCMSNHVLFYYICRLYVKSCTLLLYM